MRPIPFGRSITLTVHARGTALGLKDDAVVAAPVAGQFTVLDRGLGRVALRAEDGRLVSVDRDHVTLVRGEPTAATFQWIENVYGDLLLLSLTTNRYLRVDPSTGTISADHAGPEPDRRDGSCFDWNFHQP